MSGRTEERGNQQTNERGQFTLSFNQALLNGLSVQLLLPVFFFLLHAVPILQAFDQVGLLQEVLSLLQIVLQVLLDLVEVFQLRVLTLQMVVHRLALLLRVRRRLVAPDEGHQVINVFVLFLERFLLLRFEHVFLIYGQMRAAVANRRCAEATQIRK